MIAWAIVTSLLPTKFWLPTKYCFPQCGTWWHAGTPIRGCATRLEEWYETSYGGKASNTQAKVKWDSLTLLLSNGGLGIIDPKAQSEVFLAKLMVKGLALGHNSQPRKVDILIWLTLNRGLPIGTWLECMGILPTCKVCTEGPLNPLNTVFTNVPLPNGLGRPSMGSTQ
jgi:hypothetical protein